MSEHQPPAASPPPVPAKASPAPEAAESSSAPAQSQPQPQPSPSPQAGPSDSSSQGTQVFSAPTETTGPESVPDSFFEPTLSDVQAHHASVVARSKRLNEAPLVTSKHRDADLAAKDAKKAEKWPNTTIRIKFSDGTQIQSQFPSSSAIQPVYAFVRASLAHDAAQKPFTLYQPPRTTFPESPVPAPPVKKHINPAMKARIVAPSNYGPQRGLSTQGGTGGKEPLAQLGLVPQSMLMVRWDDADMNASSFAAPLNEELKARMKPLPPPAPVQAPQRPSGGAGAGAGASPQTKEEKLEKKMPKWLQKGLMKKKT